MYIQILKFLKAYPHTHTHIYISSSWRAASTDIPDPLSLLYECSSWSSCYWLAICRGPQERITYDLRLRYSLQFVIERNTLRSYKCRYWNSKRNKETEADWYITHWVWRLLVEVVLCFHFVAMTPSTDFKRNDLLASLREFSKKTLFNKVFPRLTVRPLKLS